jgi:hypothetical protein
MTTHSTVTDHPDRRLVVALHDPYDQARAHYETLIPEADLARFFQVESWQATLELARINAPHGFMRYYLWGSRTRPLWLTWASTRSAHTR